MGFVGNYAPRGLSPQMYDMPVIHIESSAGYVSYGALSYYSLTNLSSVRSCALVLDDEALCSTLGDYEIGTIAQCGEVYL